jgi:hypothetical protein
MPIDPLSDLHLPGKWFLGNGHAAMFAPAFPQYLDAIGFWDECYFADLRVERLFTGLVLDERWRPVALRREGERDWRPDRLRQTLAGDGLEITEHKLVLPDDVFASLLTLRNTAKHPRIVNLVVWSLQGQRVSRGEERVETVREARLSGEYLTWQWVRAEGGREHLAHFALGADRAPNSHTINVAEGSLPYPDWAISVIPDKVRGDVLAGEHKGMSAYGRDSMLHLALHYRIELKPRAEQTIALGAAASLDEPAASAALDRSLRSDPLEASEKSWRGYFESVPHFECSDAYLTRYYWYRWFGLRLMMVGLCRNNLAYPCVFEGIGGFREHISYSAQCHMLECSWMHFPQFAEGSVQNFIHCQLDSGSFPGHIWSWRHDDGFYHANWGANALQIYYLHGDQGFLKAIYPGLVRYAEYFQRERDRENSHLYDVVNQGETGQEFASRYLFVDDAADHWGPIQLKGVDATVYIYELQRSLAEIASLLEMADAARRWSGEAEATRRAVLDLMWDPKQEMFFDVHPQTRERSTSEPAVCFYPFMTDIVGAEHLGAIRNRLLNPEKFWTKWPVPTSAIDDTYFDSEAEWKGRRMSCPWTGRVWPMTNSHVCEALARAALRLDRSLAEPAAGLIRRFIMMMFFDQDLDRPNCYEHYNPFTGMPCLYRGVDDYQHSWVADLIIKYVAGIQPQRAATLVVDPLPFGLKEFTLDRVWYKGHWAKVTWSEKGGLRVFLDGKQVARTPHLERLEVALQPERK